jgi:hypothetical protein
MRKISFFFERSEKSYSSRPERSRRTRTIKILIVAVITSLTLTACSKTQTATVTPSPSPSAKDDALKNALNLYAAKKSAGADLSTGPCLGQVAPDWVADIAHNPRQKVDDIAENQCRDFLDGNAHHFVELDPDGKLIRIN